MNMRFILVLMLLSACDDFDPRSLLQAPRVVGVVAEPPAAEQTIEEAPVDEHMDEPNVDPVEELSIEEPVEEPVEEPMEEAETTTEEAPRVDKRSLALTEDDDEVPLAKIARYYES